MLLKLADRIQETSHAAGVGTVELQGAATGYRTFADVFADGDSVPYVIVSPDNHTWETGIGTVHAGSPWTLTRVTVTGSSAAGSKIAVTAGMSVFVDLTSAWANELNGRINTTAVAYAIALG